MFRPPTGSSLPPKSERACAQVLPHQLDDFPRSQTKLTPDSIERCAILPGHLNDSIQIGICQHLNHMFAGHRCHPHFSPRSMKRLRLLSRDRL